MPTIVVNRWNRRRSAPPPVPVPVIVFFSAAVVPPMVMQFFVGGWVLFTPVTTRMPLKAPTCAAVEGSATVLPWMTDRVSPKTPSRPCSEETARGLYGVLEGLAVSPTAPGVIGDLRPLALGVADGPDGVRRGTAFGANELERHDLDVGRDADYALAVYGGGDGTSHVRAVKVPA